MACCAYLVGRILKLVLFANCGTLAVFTAKWALSLSHFLRTCAFNHCGYLIDAHCMPVYSEILEDVASVGDKSHFIIYRYYEVVKALAISKTCQGFQVEHKAHTTTLGGTTWSH